MSSRVRDPAVIDRRQSSLLVVHEGEVRSRPMTISGCEGRIQSRILSKDMSGPATRLVRLSAGWGTGVAGAFTADVELFVVSGNLSVAGRTVGKYGYAAVEAGRMLAGIRALRPTLALLMTSAPVRYDSSAGGMLTQPTTASPAERSWIPVEELPGRLVMPLADGPQGQVWLAGARSWVNEDGPWHSHPTAEEVFVLEGQLDVTEAASSAYLSDGDPDGHETYRQLPGTYTFRRAGQPHAGPGSSSSEIAVAFHRQHGPRLATWTMSSDRSSTGREHHGQPDPSEPVD